MLQDFIADNRQELVERTRAKVAQRTIPRATQDELAHGVPLFLTQLVGVLERETAHGATEDAEMDASGARHGGELLEHGFTIGQVVQDYGDICQAITELALDRGIWLSTEDFRILNRCLDSTIASAVTEYARQRELGISGVEVERRGFFAHELRNHLNTAMLAFQVVKSGRVGVTGSTVQILERSLSNLRDLIDRSVLEVRLESGMHMPGRLQLAEFVEEMEIGAAIAATDRGLHFSAEPVDDGLMVDVDRHLFASAIANLLQNAFKFTRSGGHVRLRAVSTATHVTLEIEDECGGLAPEVSAKMFQPFQQLGADRSGLGLGLAISRRAIEADGGTIELRDIPGQGCVFAVTMSRAFHPVTVGS